jgi:hypothetical protein
MGDGTLRLERRWTALAGTGGNALAGRPAAVLRCRPGRGRQLLVPRSQVRLATAPGRTRQARSLDLAETGMTWREFCRMTGRAGSANGAASSPRRRIGLSRARRSSRAPIITTIDSLTNRLRERYQFRFQAT